MTSRKKLHCYGVSQSRALARQATYHCRAGNIIRPMLVLQIVSAIEQRAQGNKRSGQSRDVSLLPLWLSRMRGNDDADLSLNPNAPRTWLNVMSFENSQAFIKK